MKYRDDSDLPQVTDEELEQSLQGIRPYTITVLKVGPNFSRPGPDRDAGVASIIWQHGKRNFALRKAGLMPIVCPIADGSEVVGVSIFNATAEDAQRIMEGDPGVQARVFTYEVHPTRTFPGSTLPVPDA